MSRWLSETMRKLFTILFHPFFILCKNIFVLVETTTNPEVIDDIIKVLPLSKISDDCKNSLIKNRAPEKSFKFPPKIYKDCWKNLVKQDDTVYMNCLIISNFYHTRSQQTDCFVLHVFCSLRQHTKGQELKSS